MQTSTSHSKTEKGPFYTVFVDATEYHFDSDIVTGGEIMDRAGIPRSTGLLEILDDGTQKQIGSDETIELKPGRRLKKAPRFKRG